MTSDGPRPGPAERAAALQIARSFLQAGSTVRSLWGADVASSASPRGAACLLARRCLSRRPARATTIATRIGERRRRRRAAPAAHGGKPVPFDRGLADAVLRARRRRQAVGAVPRGGLGRAPRPASRARCKSLPRDERRAPRGDVHAGAGAREPVEVGRRGRAVRGALRRATRSSRLTTPTTPPAAGCGAATPRARWSGPARSPTGACPEAEAELVRIDALRALDRWERRARGRRELPAAVAERAAPRRGRCSRRPRRWRRPPGGERRRAEGAARRDRRSTAASGPRRRSRAGATAPPSGWSRSPRRCRRAEAAVVRTRTAGEWVSRGMVLVRSATATQESEAAFAAALARARAGRRSRVPGPLSPRAVGLEAAPAPAGGAAVRRGRRRLRARPANRDLHAKALYQGARCYASQGNRDVALARYTRVEAEHARPQLRRRRARARGGAGDRRRRRGDRRRSCWPRSRRAIRRATCSTRRCGGWRSRPGARAATTRRCAGWTRTCASSRTRRSGTRRGASSTGRGGCSRSRASPTRRATGTSARCASTRCRSTRCCR